MSKINIKNICDGILSRYKIYEQLNTLPKQRNINLRNCIMTVDTFCRIVNTAIYYSWVIMNFAIICTCLRAEISKQLTLLNIHSTIGY